VPYTAQEAPNWSDDDIAELYDLRSAGITRREIGLLLNRTGGAVGARLALLRSSGYADMSASRRRRTRWSDEDSQALIRAVGEGLSPAIIATMLERRIRAPSVSDSVASVTSGRRQLRQEQIDAERLVERLNRDMTTVQENLDLALDLMVEPHFAYERADDEQRGLLNRGYFPALYIDAESNELSGEPDAIFSDILTAQSLRLRKRRRNIAHGANAKNPRALSGVGVQESDV
jgi:hypothetical protein